MTRCAPTIFFIVILFSSAIPAHAQGIDPARMSDAEFVRYFGVVRTAHEPDASWREGGVKCGFPLNALAAARARSMSPDDRNALRRAAAPQSLDTAIVSASGFFRIHFNLTGPTSPALLVGDTADRIPGTAVQYAITLGEYFDQAYQVEVVQQGYQRPPFQTGIPYFEIYITEYNGQYYGVTDWDPGQPMFNGTVKPTYATWITVDNDFKEFYTKGLKAASVTAAHEFHHAVQLGSYGLWDSDTFMHEMTSTYFEDAVFPGVNDYFQYLRLFFAQPDRSLYLWPGYEAVLWPKLITARHDYVVLRRTWELMKAAAPMTSMQNALLEIHSGLDQEYCVFTRWNWYTRDRASQTTTERYANADQFRDQAKVVATLGLPAVFSNAVPALASQYCRVVRGNDTIVFNVANVNMTMALTKANMTVTYRLDVAASQVDASYIDAGNGFWYKLTPGMDNTFCVSVLSKGYIPDKGIVGAFPNPFHPDTEGAIRFALRKDITASKAHLAIYSPSMDLVYDNGYAGIVRDPVLGTYVEWNGRSAKNAVPASGMYFFAIEAGDKIINGKFAVIRD